MTHNEYLIKFIKNLVDSGMFYEFYPNDTPEKLLEWLQKNPDSGKE